MNQSPHFLSWTHIVQRHLQGRCLLQTHLHQEDKNQVKSQAKKGPIHRQADAQEIGQFRDQIQCSQSLFLSFPNFTQRKNTQARPKRGKDLDHPKPMQQQNLWETLQRIQGPMQNSEHLWINQQAIPQQEEPKHPTLKPIQSSRANPASIWSPLKTLAHAKPAQHRKGILPRGSLPHQPQNIEGTQVPYWPEFSQPSRTNGRTAHPSRSLASPTLCFCRIDSPSSSARR